jgi:hypothetical protein
MRRPELKQLNQPEHRRIANDASYDALIRFFERVAGYVSRGGIWAPLPPRWASDNDLLRLARRLRNREVQLTFPMDPDVAALLIEKGVEERLIVKATYEDTKANWAQHVEFQQAEERETAEHDRAVFHEVKRQAQEQGPDSLAAAQFRSLQEARREAQGSRGRRR